MSPFSKEVSFAGLCERADERLKNAGVLTNCEGAATFDGSLAWRGYESKFKANALFQEGEKAGRQLPCLSMTLSVLRSYPGPDVLPVSSVFTLQTRILR